MLHFDWSVCRFTGVLAGALLLAGCASNTSDLIASGDLSVELEPVRKGFYRDIHASADEAGLRVTGHVRRLLDPGSLDVQVLTPARELVAQARLDIRRPPRSSRVRHTRFEVRLPLVPERGSVLRLIHLQSAN